MKRIIVTLFWTVCLLGVSAEAKQDTWQVLFQTEPNMVAFASGYASPEFGITVGAHGDSRYSQGEGAPWNKAEEVEKVRCRHSMDIVNSQFAVSRGNGGVAVTKDGGVTWQQLLPFSIAEINFSDENTGWVMNTLEMKRTNDGGLTWTEMGMPNEYVNVQRISVTDYNQGWILDKEGILYSTQDGGNSWTSSAALDLIASMGDYDPIPIVSTIQFVDASQGMLVVLDKAVRNRWLICETMDGGNSWSISTIQRDDVGLFYISHDNQTLTLLEQINGKPLVTVYGRIL